MYRIGVIGCGRWGRNYIRVFSELRDTDVVHAADLDAANRDGVASRYPGIRLSDDAAAITADPQLEAVVVATNASSHYAIAADALAHGKHVIIEKPMCLSVEHCETLTALARKHQRILLVGHVFLYNDAVRKMREILQQESSGSVQLLTARRTHLGTIREDVSALWDLAAHDVAIFSYLLGEEPLSVSAVGSCFLRPGREDVVFATLFYPHGVVGHIHVSWMDAIKERRVEAVTSRRAIVFNDLDSLESIRVVNKGISGDADADSFGEFQYLVRDGDIVSPQLSRREPLKNLCVHFVDCIRTGSTPRTDGVHGVAVARVLEAADRSIAQRGRELPV